MELCAIHHFSDSTDEIPRLRYSELEDFSADAAWRVAGDNTTISHAIALELRPSSSSRRLVQEFGKASTNAPNWPYNRLWAISPLRATKIPNYFQVTMSTFDGGSTSAAFEVLAMQDPNEKHTFG